MRICRRHGNSGVAKTTWAPHGMWTRCTTWWSDWDCWESYGIIQENVWPIGIRKWWGANPAAVGKELRTVPLSVSGPTELYAADWQMPK